MKTDTIAKRETRSDRIGWTDPGETPFQFQATGSNFIDDVFATRILTDLDGNSHPVETYIPALQGDLLYSLVRHLKPDRTLEVGLANGISALHIAAALNDLGHGHHLAIDPFQHTDWRSVGLVTLKRAELDHCVSLDARPSHWALPDIEEADQRIQFAFVDGSHLMDYVMTDFMAIDRILDIGGLIAFDDSDWPGVNQVIRFALTNCNYEVFPTGMVIEPSPGTPGLATRGLRSIIRRSKRLRKIVRADFLRPSPSIGIDGRCVVLRKKGIDQRHSLLGQLINF